MGIPLANPNPPFKIVRVSHVDWTVTDMSYARDFYLDILGYHCEEDGGDTLFLRGMEEVNHHSLILRKGDRPIVNRLGFKVAAEADLDKAHQFFSDLGRPVRWVDQHAQGRTLHTTDPFGIPLEFYARMQRGERLLQQYGRYKGARIQRIDHINLFHYDVNAATEFWAHKLGFQVTEVTVTDASDPESEIWAAWLHRKGGVHDIAWTNGYGPRLHHLGVWVPTATDIINFCDILATSGHMAAFERGPGRHGISNAFFLYIRDRDGHRTELFASDYLTIDPDHPVRVWNLDDPQRQTLWGQPAPRSWFEKGSVLAGVEPRDALLTAQPIIAPD